MRRATVCTAYRCSAIAQFAPVIRLRMSASNERASTGNNRRVHRAPGRAPVRECQLFHSLEEEHA
jgi:hypothetical protein